MKTSTKVQAKPAKKVAKKGKKLSQVVKISAVTGKPKRVRRDRGRRAAAKAATMTKEEWDAFQTDKYKKAWPKPDYMLEAAQKGDKLVYVRDGGEGAYKDKTYEVVTRWTAKTRIAYRPHAKAPGSKSHVRYEKYAKAKNVGEALALGSYPIDWCYDYEHGFIKVLGGEVRDEPLDISKVEDERTLTDVDNCLVRWYRRELAKRYKLDIRDLYTEKGGGESVLMRAHRLVADRKAKEMLSRAEKTKAIITDDQVTEVLSTWAFARNETRQNVIPGGRNWVWSDTVGLLRDRMGDIHITKMGKIYQNFTSLICRWLTARLPKEVADFKFTTLNLNCNYAAKRHRDGNNFGPSMIKAFGDFEGGELTYFPNDDKSVDLDKLKMKDSKTFDLSADLAMFNGNSAHEVSDFEGTRFSVVYFTLGCHAKAKKEDMAQLKKMGFLVPAPDEDQFALLGKPGSKGKPLLRSWNANQLATKKRKL